MIVDQEVKDIIDIVSDEEEDSDKNEEEEEDKECLNKHPNNYSKGTSTMIVYGLININVLRCYALYVYAKLT
jgi:hypothetical protein